MKAEDLMIGDWVNVNGENCYVTLATLYTLQFTGKSNTIKPIPLTSEILEKNGFKKKVWYCGINNIITYEIVDNFHVEVSKNGKGFCIVDNIKDYGDHTYEANWLVDIKCVHELQHILKDFKIEKEIVL